MKKKLLLYLAKLNISENIPVSSTLAWLAKSQNVLFDLYYDSYHRGVHFPGGDSRELELGQLTGGTVPGDRHFEGFHYTLLNFEVSAAIFKDTIFHSCINNFHVTVAAFSDRINDFYKKIFSYFEVPLPLNIVMIGSHFHQSLSGLEAYLYPEIYYRQALGVPDFISENELADLCQKGGKVTCVCVDENVVTRLRQRGYDIEIIDQVKRNDEYLNITKRIAERWASKAKGWILGDPTLVAHWLPKATEEDLIAVYSVPQEKIINSLSDLISSKGDVVYGRQYHDKDFFDLSKLNKCLQAIDPCRPPFQSVKHIEYSWHSDMEKEGLCKPEFSDEELRQFGREGRILISLMFWSGMIREMSNFYNLMDLIALTKIKCGLVLTAQSYEYMMHSPLELITIPLEQGGVFPLVEPVLGSCGLGVGIESCMTNDRLENSLKDALSRILRKVKRESLLPKGWWATLDTNLERLSVMKRPKPLRFLKYSPYFQVRYKAEETKKGKDFQPAEGKISDSADRTHMEKIKRGLQKAGLTKYFVPYRPYEGYRAGPLRQDIVKTVKSAGLEYMFSKSGFAPSPRVKYLDDEFIVLNFTAGQWDGWTPFETVNDVSDLIKSEKLLLKRKKPGWIVSTIDSCLWTFGGEFWKQGSRLYEIARFCAERGKSKKLINVKPCTVARYARIIADL